MINIVLKTFFFLTHYSWKKKVSNNNILARWSAFITINASVGGDLRREKPTSYLRLSRSHRVLLYPCCPLSDTLLHHPDQA